MAHEEGDLNDLRAIVGNDVAIEAYREGKLPFPDGAIIARLAWSYEPSEENNKAFGRSQSCLQFSRLTYRLEPRHRDKCNHRSGRAPKRHCLGHRNPYPDTRRPLIDTDATTYELGNTRTHTNAAEHGDLANVQKVVEFVQRDRDLDRTNPDEITSGLELVGDILPESR